MPSLLFDISVRHSEQSCWSIYQHIKVFCDNRTVIQKRETSICVHVRGNSNILEGCWPGTSLYLFYFIFTFCINSIFITSIVSCFVNAFKINNSYCIFPLLCIQSFYRFFKDSCGMHFLTVCLFFTVQEDELGGLLKSSLALHLTCHVTLAW